MKDKKTRVLGGHLGRRTGSQTQILPSLVQSHFPCILTLIKKHEKAQFILNLKRKKDTVNFSVCLLALHEDKIQLILYQCQEKSEFRFCKIMAQVELAGHVTLQRRCYVSMVMSCLQSVTGRPALQPPCTVPKLDDQEPGSAF